MSACSTPSLSSLDLGHVLSTDEMEQMLSAELYSSADERDEDPASAFAPLSSPRRFSPTLTASPESTVSANDHIVSNDSNSLTEDLVNENGQLDTPQLPSRGSRLGYFGPYDNIEGSELYASLLGELELLSTSSAGFLDGVRRLICAHVSTIMS